MQLKKTKVGTINKTKTIINHTSDELGAFDLIFDWFFLFLEVSLDGKKEEGIQMLSNNNKHAAAMFFEMFFPKVKVDEIIKMREHIVE